MTKIFNRTLAALGLRLAVQATGGAETTGAADPRTRLGLTEGERTEFLAEMR